MSDLLQYTTSESLEGYDLLRDGCGLYEPTHLTPILFRGDDRKGWLQGQVTNNLRSFDIGTATAFAFCEVTGHLASVADAWSLPDTIAATVPSPTVDAVAHRVSSMVVLEDVTFENASRTHKVLSIQGPQATRRLGEMIPLPSLDAGTATLEGADIYVLRSNRTGMGGWDLWIPSLKRKALKTIRDAFPRVSDAAYDVARLEAGIPRWGEDIEGRVFPAELGSHFLSRHVNFNKGCYLGQEVIMRMHSRGHTNKTWVGLVAEGPFAVGDVIHHARKGEVGRVSSAGFSPDYGHIGAAIVRNEAAFEREIVRIKTGSGAVEAEVHQMPILRIE